MSQIDGAAIAMVLAIDIEKSIASSSKNFTRALALLLRVYEEGYDEQVQGGDEGELLEGTVIPDDVYDDIEEFLAELANI